MVNKRDHENQIPQVVDNNNQVDVITLKPKCGQFSVKFRPGLHRQLS